MKMRTVHAMPVVTRTMSALQREEIWLRSSPQNMNKHGDGFVMMTWMRTVPVPVPRVLVDAVRNHRHRLGAALGRLLAGSSRRDIHTYNTSASNRIMGCGFALPSIATRLSENVALLLWAKTRQERQTLRGASR